MKRGNGVRHGCRVRYGAPWREKIMVQPDGCWRWLGAIDGKGYANMRVGDSVRKAHRVIYEQVVGPIPAGFDLHHVCPLRRCVNPAHQQPVPASPHRQWDSRRRYAGGGW